MARLTWQNVDPPSFANVADSYRLMGQLLGSGVNSAQAAIERIQNSRADGNASAAALELFRSTTPEQLDQVLASGALGKYGTLDDNTIKLIGDRSGVLLRNAEQGLVNAQRAESNQQTAWQNANTRSYEANRPAALKAANEIRMYAEMGTPDSLAKARSLQQQHGDTFAKAGWTPDQALQLAAGNMQASTSGMALNDAFVKAQDAQTEREQNLAAEAIFGAVVQASSDKDDAAQKLRQLGSLGLNPKVATKVLGQINSEGADALFGPGADPNAVIVDQALQEAASRGAAPKGDRLITYANQGATRNLPLSAELTAAITPVLQDLGVGMKVFSGGQHSNKPGEGTGSTRHNDGHAGDVEFYSLADGHRLDPRNPADVPLLQEIVRRGKANGITGWGEGADYMGSGRVHLGFGNPAVWGAGGKGDNAPQWLRDAYGGAPAGQRPLSSSGEGAAAAIGRASQETGKLLDAAGNQDLLSRGMDLASRGATIMDTITADTGFNPIAPLVSDLVSPQNPDMKRAEVAAELHKDLGDSNDLSLPDLTEAVNHVVDKFGIKPYLAGAFIKDSIQQNSFFARHSFWGDRSVDYDAIDRKVAEFIDPATKSLKQEKLQGALEQMAQIREKSQAGEKIKASLEQVERAKQSYFNAVEKARQGGKVDVAKALQRYQLLLDLAEARIAKENQNPMVRANTAAKTGR